MSIDSTPDAGAEAGPSPADSADDARYAAAFAEEGLSAETGAPAAAPAESGGDSKPAAAAEPKEPLAPEEVHKRWEDTKAALRAERREARELKQRLERLEQARTAPPAAATQAPAEPVLERPDPDTDPIGYMKYVDARISAGDAVEAQRQAQEQQRSQQERVVQTIVHQVAEREADFALDTPDYYEAVNHLRQVRTEQYEALGFTKAQAEAKVNQDALTTSAQLLQAGQDPAQAYYKLAKASGFNGKPAAASDQKAHAAAAAAATPNQTNDALDRIRAGQKAAQTLSGTGGSANTGEPDMGQVASLKGAAFDSAFDKLREAARSAERRTGF
jgi:hypothetical protein